MLKDYFRFAFGNLTHRKLRSWLTMIGIFIGIASVVALISLVQGFQTAIQKEFEKIGTDKIFITAKSGFSAPGANAAIELTKEDMKIVKKVAGVENAAAFILENAKVEFEDNIGFFPIQSLPKGEEGKLLDEVQSLSVKEGRKLRDNDVSSALIGANFISNQLLGKNLGLREKIILNGNELTIVGILEKTGDPVGDKAVYIPEDTLRDIFDEPERIDTIMVKVADVSSLQSVSEKIKNDLRKQRDVKKGEEDFDLQTPEQLLGSFGDILNIVQIVLIGIAAISLIVGGVGIANTMYTSVIERTKEIGIMKSVGAENKDIMILFMIESGMLGAIGGLIGAVIGFSLSKGIELIAKNSLGTTLIEAYFSFYLFFGAILFAFFLGVLFGAMPARRASSLKPVEALRFK